MLSKARMKLNIKKLYSADGLAVKELLKLAQLLHKARAQASQQEEVSRQGNFCHSATGRQCKVPSHCAGWVLSISRCIQQMQV